MNTHFLRLRRPLWAILLAAAIALGFLSNSLVVHFNNFTLKGSSGELGSITMPFLKQGTGANDYVVEGEMELGWLSPSLYNVIPDDLLLKVVINGQQIDLSDQPYDRLKDVNQGVMLNLGRFLHSGSNHVEIHFRDFSGDMGLDIKTSPLDWHWAGLGLAWVLLVSIAAVAVLQCFGLSRARSLCYWLIVAGSVIRVAYIFTYNPIDHIFSDPQRHWEQGTEVLRKDLMALTDPIGYQIYVGVLAKLSLKLPVLVAFYTSLLALLGAWFWYRFLREAQANKTLALAGWAFVSLLPSWTAIYAYFMQETLMLPMLGAALWATWRCRRKADLASFLAMVFFWVAAGLTRGIAIPMAAVACSWLWLAQDGKFKKALYSFAVLLFILGPLTVRSYTFVHHFAPHGMGQLNVIYAQSGKKVIEINVADVGRWGFGSPSTGAKPFAPFSDWMTQRTGTVEAEVNFQKGKGGWQPALDQVHMSLSDYLWIAKENLIFLFFAESWPDVRAGRLVDGFSSVMRWLWAPLFLFTVIVLIKDAKKLRRQWLLTGLIAAWFVVQGLIPIAINEGRYRKPLEGLLAAQLVLWLAARQGALRLPAAKRKDETLPQV
ncbi:MAG TPA: hypothetical protein VIZ65_11910 [Cellvibrionaceae bacterium]